MTLPRALLSLRGLHATPTRSSAPPFSSHQRTVLWVLWLTYGSFYFCRNNLGVALPGLQAEFGFTKAQLGTILMALKLAYGVGQFINGQLAERWSPRRLLALGLLGSAVLNVLFGWASGLYFLTFVWACNGYVQALGWPPTMRAAANWFPATQRGRAIGIIGTGYQLCGALTFALSGWAAERFGWRGALYVPAALLTISALHMLLLLEDAPADQRRGTRDQRPETGDLALRTAANPEMPEVAGRGVLAEPLRETQNPDPVGRLTGDGSPCLPNSGYRPSSIGREAGTLATPPASAKSFRANIVLTLSNPALWLVALALCLLDACRYGFTDWGVTHLKEVLNDNVRIAAFKYAILPFGGMVGAYWSGWATDRWCAGRRAPVICALLVVLGGLGIGYDRVLHWGVVPSVLILFAIGFCIFGSQVLLVGTLPIDLAKEGTAAAAAGFVNFMGYMGAAAGDKVTGQIAEDHGWQFAVRFWSACAFASAIAIAFLWNAGRRAER